MTRAQEMAAEALTSYLAHLPWTAILGETRPLDNNEVRPAIWLRLSEHPEKDVSARQDPKQVMVCIRQFNDGIVGVQVSWLNLSGDDVLRGDQNLRITTAGMRESDLHAPVESAAQRILEIYRDVLGGTGVAGPEGVAQAAPEPTPPTESNNNAQD